MWSWSSFFFLEYRWSITAVLLNRAIKLLALYPDVYLLALLADVSKFKLWQTRTIPNKAAICELVAEQNQIECVHTFHLSKNTPAWFLLGLGI